MAADDLAWLRSRRVLLSNNLPLDRQRQPLFSDDFQYVTMALSKAAGPRVLSVPDNSEFDCAALALPAGWSPEVFIAKIDSRFYLTPRNVAALRCPRVLILGITHFGKRALQRMIEYASSEPYDFYIVEHFRHHLWHYWRAGIRNLYWLPGLLHKPAPAAGAPPAPSLGLEGRAVFLGQAGKYHPRRTRLLPALAAREPRFAFGQMPLDRSFQAYREAAVSVNMSLNGDLNRRTFEVLSAGGFLLSDELTGESGVDLILDKGREYDSYDDPEGLASKVEYYLEHREARERMRAAGHDRYRREYAPDRMEAELARLLQGREVGERHAAASVPRIRHCSPGEPHPERLAVYEAVQEMHLRRERIHLLHDARFDLAAPVDFLDLPRLQVTVSHATAGQQDALRNYREQSRDGARLRFVTEPDPAERFNIIVSTEITSRLLACADRDALVLSNDRIGRAQVKAGPQSAGISFEADLAPRLFALGYSGSAS